MMCRSLSRSELGRPTWCGSVRTIRPTGAARSRQADHEGRNAPVGSSPVTQLAQVVEAPAIEAAVCRLRTRVAVASRDSHDTAESHHRNGRVARARRPIADLSIEVGSPAEGVPGRGSSAGVQVTGSQLGGDKWSCGRSRDSSVQPRPVSELSRPVATPTLDARGPRACEGSPHGNVDRSTQHLDSGGIEAIDHGAVPHLTLVASAPAEDIAGASASTCVLAASGDLDRIGETSNQHRSGPVGRRAVTELAIGVSSPAVDLARSRRSDWAAARRFRVAARLFFPASSGSDPAIRRRSPRLHWTQGQAAFNAPGVPRKVPPDDEYTFVASHQLPLPTMLLSAASVPRES